MYENPLLKRQLFFVLNNRDINIDQNNHEYDFCHNFASRFRSFRNSVVIGIIIAFIYFQPLEEEFPDVTYHPLPILQHACCSRWTDGWMDG